MCGIFGIVGGPLSTGELAAMSRLQRHRGPDDEGVLVVRPDGISCAGGDDTPPAVMRSDVPYAPRQRLDEERPDGIKLALGHRRLSILDLSAHGHQPMSYRDRWWIVFNGEIYNYLELRDELVALGHSFSTGTDTEVILAAYAEWGPGCLTRFNGMWGLAILDLQRKTLFLSRDRFGVKPLYLRAANGRIAFASEIKAFTALSDWRPRANLPRLLDFLVWNVTDHGAETMFDGVEQLPAGHYLLVDVGPAIAGSRVDGYGSPDRWYRLPDPAPPPADGAAALREALADAVRLRLRADVTVGSCLSGGLDSSSIVCLMSRMLDGAGAAGRLKTVTALSSEKEFDEGRYAEAVVAKARSEPVYVTPEPPKLFEDLSRLVWHQDEPFVSSSIFAQWCVFEAARRNGVTVMLDGQGADETLCGYRGFFGAYLASLFRTGRWFAWWREIEATRREIGFGRKRLLGYTAAYVWPASLGILGRFDNRAYADRTWIRRDHLAAFARDPVAGKGGRAASVREMSVAQITATNLPMLLHWEDRNSMAFSVEARVPFLDYRVVELSLSLADEDKLGCGISKGVLRRAMRGVVPDPILDRRDKMGFLTAESSWMTRDASASFRRGLTEAVGALQGVLDPGILHHFDEVVSGRRPYDPRYWRALCAGRWASAFSVDVPT